MRVFIIRSQASEADAGAWEVSYLASGKPLFVHIRTGFRTFEKPPALGGESSVVLPCKPVSTLAALPVQSNWHEHRAAGSGDLVYYRNAKTGEVNVWFVRNARVKHDHKHTKVQRLKKECRCGLEHTFAILG